MVEEENQKPEEEVKKTYLEEVKEERERLEKVRDELRELKTEEILSGRSDVTKEREKPQVETELEYAKRALSGQIDEK